MSQTERTLRELRTAIGAIRLACQDNTANVQLERSRIDALERALIAQARHIPELEHSITANRRSINGMNGTATKRHEAVKAAVAQQLRDAEAVTHALTESIFRLEARLDRLHERLGLVGYMAPPGSHVEHHTNLDKLDAELRIDAPHHVVAPLAADAKGGIAPEPAKLAE